LKTYSYTDLSKQNIEDLCLRQQPDDAAITDRVKEIIAHVKTAGDKALIDYALAFDKVNLERLFIDQQEIEEIASGIPDEAKKAIDTAYVNIKKFHAAQLYKEEKVNTMPGVSCWREARPIERVDLFDAQ